MLNQASLPFSQPFPPNAYRRRIHRYTQPFTCFAHTAPTVRQYASTKPLAIILPPPTSAYIHLPFSRKRCHYCDFTIVALGSASTQAEDDPRMTNHFQSGYQKRGSAEFYKMASRTLSDAGYNHYEISSYCKSGYHCTHNLTYWKNKPFYAFGLGSASYVDGMRFSRPKRIKEYTGYVENMENGLVDCGESTRTVQDMATDVVMLSLRTSRDPDGHGAASGGRVLEWNTSIQVVSWHHQG